MRTVYADAVYFVALLIRSDRFHATAVAFDDADPRLRITTCDAVLLEVLAYVASRGTSLRSAALELIDTLRVDDRVVIVRQTPELFDEALDLYRRRPDKEYSLVDCMSMIICRQLGISEVLTHDRHFKQEGFIRLLADD